MRIHSQNTAFLLLRGRLQEDRKLDGKFVGQSVSRREIANLFKTRTTVKVRAHYESKYGDPAISGPSVVEARRGKTFVQVGYMRFRGTSFRTLRVWALGEAA